MIANLRELFENAFSDDFYTSAGAEMDLDDVGPSNVADLQWLLEETDKSSDPKRVTLAWELILAIATPGSSSGAPPWPTLARNPVAGF